MPEGDTLVLTAEGLRPHLLGRPVTAARARVPGPQVERVVGATVTDVRALGKNLLIRFDNGLELRTHLRMRGSWHRYRPGERWTRASSRARLVLEVPGTVAVCFDAPVVELFEARTEVVHPALATLGPDVLADDFDPSAAVARLREPARAVVTIGEALLDQRALAGIGNVYRSEVLFLERVSPLARVRQLDEGVLARLVATARAVMARNVAGRNRSIAPRVTTNDDGRDGGRLWVYGRRGRPCRRCGTTIVAASIGGDLPRTAYWCPRCQPGSAA